MKTSNTVVVSQASAVAASVAKVNGSAEQIVLSAISAHKAYGKVAEHVRAAFASPASVVNATLTAVFQGLDSKLMPKGGHTDHSRAEWATVANSVATHVRNVWNKLPEDTRPALCYIALNRADCTAVVQVLQSPTKQELKNALGNDTKALNAAMARIHSKTTTPGGATKNPATAPAPMGKIGPVDSNAPVGGTIAAIMQMAQGLTTGELDQLAKRIVEEINARTAAALEKAEKAGRGPAAKGKGNSKTSPQAQAKAKEIGQGKAA